MYIHFLLDGWPDALRTNIETSLFEMAIRMGYKFVLHRSASTVPTNGFIVSYSPTRPTDISVNLALIATAEVYNNPNLNGPVQHATEWLWASQKMQHLDVISGTYHLLSFAHEQNMGVESYDEMGRIHPDQHPLQQHGLLQIPLIENNTNYLLNLLKKAGLPDFQHHTPWPKDRYVVSMTHDVDGPRLLKNFALVRSAFLGFLKRNQYERESFLQGLLALAYKKEDPYWNFDAWMILEDYYGLKSAFYFYPAPLQSVQRHFHDPRYKLTESDLNTTIHKIIDNGWECGLHIGINGHTQQGYTEAVELFRDQFNISEVGCRAHYWSIDWKSPHRSFEQMERAGLSYDCSLSPQAIGYRNGTMYPICASNFWRGLQKPYFISIPTAFMDGYLLKRTAPIPISKNKVNQVLENAKAKNGLILLDWHVRSMHNQGTFRGFLTPLYNILNAVATDQRCLFMTPSQIAAHWQNHIENVFMGVV